MALDIKYQVVLQEVCLYLYFILSQWTNFITVLFALVTISCLKWGCSHFTKFSIRICIVFPFVFRAERINKRVYKNVPTWTLESTGEPSRAHKSVGLGCLLMAMVGGTKGPGSVRRHQSTGQTFFFNYLRLSLMHYCMKIKLHLNVKKVCIH